MKDEHEIGAARPEGGKVGKLLLASTFPCGARQGGGNVIIPPVLRDFPGTFPRPPASVSGTAVEPDTALCTASVAAPWRAFIWRAQAMSLIASASRSSSARLRPGLRYCSRRSAHPLVHPVHFRQQPYVLGPVPCREAMPLAGSRSHHPEVQKLAHPSCRSPSPFPRTLAPRPPLLNSP